MKAMVLEKAGAPLVLKRVARPVPGPDQVLLKVAACGVCRTDLHILDGELPDPERPLIPGHEIVGTVVEVGSGAKQFQLGDQVGVPWLGHTCGACAYCAADRENLCDRPEFTGYTRDGGYAEYAVADTAYCFPVPESLDPVEAAPFMCAGLIGHRAYRMAGDAPRLGLYGFGAAAHILAQTARFEGRSVYAFTKPGDESGQGFARQLGCTWAGGSDQTPPEPLDAAILFAPVGALVPIALKSVRKGGRVICAGIHMSDIPSFPYRDLWQERAIQSVANLTRQDGVDFLALAAKAGVKNTVKRYPLAEANQALNDLRAGSFNGAAVLIP